MLLTDWRQDFGPFSVNGIESRSLCRPPVFHFWRVAKEVITWIEGQVFLLLEEEGHSYCTFSSLINHPTFWTVVKLYFHENVNLLSFNMHYKEHKCNGIHSSRCPLRTLRRHYPSTRYHPYPNLCLHNLTWIECPNT